MRARTKWLLVLALFSIPGIIYGGARYSIHQQYVAARKIEAEMLAIVQADREKFQQWLALTKQLSESQVREAIPMLMQVRRSALAEDARAYFALADVERIEFLDERINEADIMRTRVDRPEHARAENGSKSLGESSQDVRQSDFRSQLREYLRDLQQRRTARGLPGRHRRAA